MSATTCLSSSVWLITTNCCQVSCYTHELDIPMILGCKTFFYNHEEGPVLCAGWSHFAQFTIAVVNKDPKKSKYSGLPFAFPTL